MYFWRLSSLYYLLAQEQINQKNQFQHCVATLLYVSAGLLGSGLFPALYWWCIHQLNGFIVRYVGHGKPVPLFNEYNQYINIAVYILVFTGIWYCFSLNQRLDKRNFLERFWTLSWPALVHATVYSSILFLLTMGTTIGFYFYKLIGISLLSSKTAPTFLLKWYGNTIEKGGITTSLHQLRLIKELGAAMNTVSWYAYLASCITSIVHIAFFIRIMQRALYSIARIAKDGK